MVDNCGRQLWQRNSICNSGGYIWWIILVGNYDSIILVGNFRKPFRWTSSQRFRLSILMIYFGEQLWWIVMVDSCGG